MAALQEVSDVQRMLLVFLPSRCRCTKQNSRSSPEFPYISRLTEAAATFYPGLLLCELVNQQHFYSLHRCLHCMERRSFIGFAFLVWYYRYKVCFPPFEIHGVIKTCLRMSVFQK